MKILSFFAGLLCLAGNCFAQHLLQIDDGRGNYLLLAPPPSLSGSRTLSLPLPPLTPMAAGFIGTGTATGQIPIWDNSQLAWMAVNSNAALNAMLPSQPGNNGKVLFTDGTNTGWTAILPGGAVSVFGRTGIVTAQTGDYNFSLISGSATASQLPNLQNMNGLLDIAHGGTGQTTANAALNVFLPTQTGNANKILQTDGTNTSWVLIPSAPVLSVFGRTGIVVTANNDYSFSQISGSAIASQLPNLQSMNGLLDISRGGTGQTTANAALNAFLPTQTGNANKILQTDGTNATWISPTSPLVSSVFGRTGSITSATNDYSFSQISGSALASQLPNLQSMNGLLDIAHGGTGQITANAALNALLPTQTGNANKVLQTDGTNSSWISPISPLVSSVFGRTGAITSATGDYSFSQILGSATAGQLPNLQAMNGLLDIAHGGTGQATANAALNTFLPTQTGNSNKILQTDGTNSSWVIIPSAPVLSVFGRTGIIIAANNDYNFSQVAGSATASQVPNLQNMNGLLDIAHGGTGQITANASLNALLATQTGNANKVLQTDGTNTSWVLIPSAPVLSVFGRTGIVVAANNDYSFSQISGSAIGSQLPNLQNLNGLLDIAHGGTGQITANAALNVLLPTQAGNANKVLQTDGTNTNWILIPSAPVTSVFGRTGAIVAANNDYSFSQISGSAIASQLPNLQVMNGVLDLAHGGTGQITANAALNALLPTQSGNANKVLQTDGTNANWISPISPLVSSVFGRTGSVVSASGDYSFSQISGSAIASQLPNLQTMNGLLDIAHGGTGQITPNAALNAMLPTQTGNANKVLQTDGTNTTWIGLISPPVSSVFGRTGAITSASGDYNFSQISGSAIANQLPNLQSMNGLLDIAHGGSGQTTANAALNAFLPTQTGNVNKVLQTDGTNTNWILIPSAPVTSVFGRTGVIVAANNDYSFSQISGSATASQLPNLQNLNGLLDIAHGGSGQSTANAALNVLLPTQTGNGTKYLQTDGTNTSWVSIINPPVTSVFGRVGVIVSANNDYSFSQISGSATASQLPNLQNMNGLLDIAHGGTGISSFTIGDLPYTSASNTLSALAGNTTSTKKFLTQTGNGTLSAAPAWNVIVAADIPVMVASGASHSGGAVPDPGAASGTTKFLREDATWQVPAGGGTGTVTSVGLSMPGEFSTGAAVTTSGNLSASWSSQTTNKVFAAPDGSTGTPAFRALTANDIASGMINYAKIQNVAANSILGNNTGSGATAIELSASQVKTMLAMNNVENTALSTWAGSANITSLGTIGTGSWNATSIGAAKGGTGISSYTLGDMLYASAGTTLTILSGNATSTKKFLTQSGNGSVSATPVWNTIVAGDIPVMVASGGSHSAGAVPDPGSTSGTTKFLREDGSWQVPTGGGGGSPAGSNTEVQYNNSGAFGSSSNFIFNNGGVSVTNSSTTDEQYSIFGKATGATANQVIGVWGSASNGTSNTGTIGVLATGSGNTTAGSTNVALQINDGEFTMGRTSQSPGTGTAVEAATVGTAYSQEGPSGVIELDFKGAADLTLASNVFENFVSGITINNRYVTTNSIILVEVLSQSEGSTNQSGTTFATKNVTFSTSVRNRAAGSFVLTVDIHNATGANIVVDGGAASSDKDKIRVGYTVINPGR